MLNMIIAFLPQVLKKADNLKISSSYKSELEKYIISKNPQSVSDIEYWTTQYDRKQARRNWLS
jgi:hypothetical protein